MDFRELSYVLAIAQYKNITKAAEALYVTQPTLSKFLAALEEELGQKLFRRIGHRYELTYAGERYVEAATCIMNIKSDLDVELADIIKKDVGVLNVAFPHMRCSYMLPKILPMFQEVYPNVKVNLFEGSSSENDQKILDGKLDFAFGSEPAEKNPLLSYEILGTEELLMITCKDHPIKSKAKPVPGGRYPELNPALLKEERVLKMRSNQRTRQITDDYLKQKGIVLENCMETSSMPAIIGLVEEGYGVSFIFETHLKHRASQKPIDCYSFAGSPVKSHFIAAYRQGSYLPAYAKEFIEITKKVFEEG